MREREREKEREIERKKEKERCWGSCNRDPNYGILLGKRPSHKKMTQFHLTKRWPSISSCQSQCSIEIFGANFKNNRKIRFVYFTNKKFNTMIKGSKNED